MNISLSPEARDLLEVVLIAGISTLRAGVERGKIAQPELAESAIDVALALKDEIQNDQRKTAL